MLEPYREPEQSLGRPRVFAFDRCPMLDQAFDTAETRCLDKKFRSAGCALSRLPARQFNGEHPAKSAHLFRRDVMPGMRFQSRVMHFLHSRMIGQPRGYL